MEPEKELPPLLLPLVAEAGLRDAGNELAAGLQNGLFAAGKSVPEDFEIITSNDSSVTQFTRPNLSSISQPVYDLGAVSMRMLTKIMHKEDLDEKEIVLNHGLVKRGSTR